MLTENRIREIEKSLSTRTIGIIGDFCLDIYWYADMTRSELSRETPHFPLPVVDEKIYLGAGGNVASNVAALNPGKLCAMSLYGADWRGNLMKDILDSAGIDASYFVRNEKGCTNAYCKPMRMGISSVVYEDPRLDFENRTCIDASTENQVIENLKQMAQKVDVLCVADQFQCGIVTDRVREEILRLTSEGLTVIADSRYRIADYKGCIIKPNEVECWKAVYHDQGYLNAGTPEFLEAADRLAAANDSTVFCTLGANGSYITRGSSGIRIPALKLEGELDICGAGDTSLSAFACALSSGAALSEAAELAALASAVTVKKIGVTGTASFNEIIEKLS